MDLILNSSSLTFVGEIAHYLLALVGGLNEALWFLAFVVLLFVSLFLFVLLYISYSKFYSKPTPLFFNTKFIVLLAHLVLIILVFSLFLILLYTLS